MHQVTLRTLSGDVLETTAFRSHESDDRALGSLVAMGKKFEKEGATTAITSCSTKEKHQLQ